MRGINRKRFVFSLALVGVLGFGHAPTVVAQPVQVVRSRTVLVESVTCPSAAREPLSMRGLTGRVTMELTSMGVVVTTAPDPSLERIRLTPIACDRNANTLRVSVSLGAPATEVFAGEVAIPRQGEAERDRVVALGVAELLRNYWSIPREDPNRARDERVTELATALDATRTRAAAENDALRRQLEDAHRAFLLNQTQLARLRQDVARLQRTATAQERRAATAQRERAALPAQLTFLGAVTSYSAASTTLVGAVLGGDLPLAGTRLLLEGGVSLGSGSTAASRTQLASLFLGSGVLAPFSLGLVSGGIGAAARMGYVWADGEANEALAIGSGSLSNVTFELAGRLVIDVPVSRRIRARVDLAAGYELLGIDGRFDDAPVAAIAGPLLRVAFGLAVAP